jgi:hypothetical protein
MAKTKGNTNSMDFAELDAIMSKISPRGSISTHNVFSKIDEYIHSGNYTFNAQLSGSLFGGIPNCRSVAFAGSPGTGKTFLALNACREAQRMGYQIIYCDSEAAVDATTFKKFGLDPDRVRYQPVNTPHEFRFFVSNLLDQLKTAREGGRTVPKIMMVLDSLGNLATTKERNDAISGSEKRDMTKQQELRSLFRVITMDLAEAKIPLILTAHTYACIHGDNEVLMSNGTYKKISQINPGEFVMTLAGEKPVLEIFKYEVKNYIEFEFEDGYNLKCTNGHKLAIVKDNEIVYKFAEDLEEGDEVIID